MKNRKMKGRAAIMLMTIMLLEKILKAMQDLMEQKAISEHMNIVDKIPVK